MAGVGEIKSIKDDIQLAHSTVSAARANTKTLINGFEAHVIRLGMLKAKKARLQKIIDLLNANLKNCVQQYKTIAKRIRSFKYYEAQVELSALKDSLKQLLNSSRKRKSPLLIAEQLNKSVKTLELEIKQGVRIMVSRVICKFSTKEYASICKHYEMLGKDAELAEDVKDQYTMIVERNAVQVLTKYSKSGAGKCQGADALCAKVNVHELVDILNELFKFHASILQSYCSMILFHEESQVGDKKVQPRKVVITKPITGFHQVVRRLFTNSKKSVWNLMQSKLERILLCLEEKIVELSIPELFEVLAICSRYFLLGKDFSDTSLSKY